MATSPATLPWTPGPLINFYFSCELSAHRMLTHVSRFAFVNSLSKPIYSAMKTHIPKRSLSLCVLCSWLLQLPLFFSCHTPLASVLASGLRPGLWPVPGGEEHCSLGSHCDAGPSLVGEAAPGHPSFPQSLALQRLRSFLVSSSLENSTTPWVYGLSGGLRRGCFCPAALRFGEVEYTANFGKSERMFRSKPP